MKLILADSSQQDGSNGGIFITLASIDDELFTFYCLKSFAINSLTIDPRNMIISPFDPSGYDESNKVCLAFFQSLGSEITWFKFLLKIHFFINFINFEI